jgi:DNA-directed RNA polymerase specialized sigma24 family protein
MECVRLRMEDLRYEEIAGVLGLSAGTVGALLARAHGKIRKAVGGRKDRDLAPTAAGEERYAS